MTLPVIIETSAHGLVTAKFGDHEDLQATQPTQEEAIRILKTKLQRQIEMGRLVLIDIPTTAGKQS